jgi:hypothetical protein
MEKFAEDFVASYVAKLKNLEKPDDLKKMYQWFWEQKDKFEVVTKQMNEDLGLEGEYTIQPDLPCLGYGSMQGLVLLHANPAWNEEFNTIEDSYVRQSADNYSGLFSDFFNQYPCIFEPPHPIPFWTQAISFVRLLKDWQDRFGELLQGLDRWQQASNSRLVGGWEIFPFHSGSDGVTPRIADKDWVKKIAIESVRAAIRMNPEVLFVASSGGSTIVKEYVLPRAVWISDFIGNSCRTEVSYTNTGKGTEVVTIARQIFAAPRDYTDEQVVDIVRNLRERWHSYETDANQEV